MKIKTTILGLIVLGMMTLSTSISFGQTTPPAADNGICSDPAVKVMKMQFAALDPDTRLAIWRAHLTKQLDTRALTGRQRALIVKILGLANVELYRGLPMDAATKALWEPLREELHREFSIRDGAEIFGRPDQDVFDKFAAGKVNLITAKAVQDLRCECSVSSDWCSRGNCVAQGCGLGCPTCTPNYDGCGTLWIYQCNGMCHASTKEE